MIEAMPSKSRAATYSGVHRAVAASRGAASRFRCACGTRAAEWAYIHDQPDPARLYDPSDGSPYSTDLSRYRPMCRRCHRRYDKAYITACPAGHPYAGANLLIDTDGNRKCRTCVYARNNARPLSRRQVVRKSGLQRTRRAKARARAKLRGCR